MKNCINILLIIIIIILLFLNFNKHRETFNKHIETFNNNSIQITKSIYTPLIKISKAQDFNTFGLISKLKFGIIKNPTEYKNIIIIPGLGDCILKQNNNIVWPINCSDINKNNYTSVHENNYTHLKTILNLFSALNYSSDKLNTLVYDFINLDISKIILIFKELLKKNTIIIAYDFGAVIANLCIQKLSEDEKKQINHLLLICPTIGGVPLSVREYLNGNDIINNNSTQNIDTTLLSFPNKQIYNNPVIIYNKIKYSSNNLSNLIKTNLNEDFDNSECLKIQEESLKNPKVNTIIIGSTGYNTPLCYDYMNNLRDTPKKYSISNYINTPNNNNLIEGLQVNGDLVVPTDNLYKLQSLWGDNCKLEILKNINHYSILKSYELCIIILKYLNN